MEILIFLTYKTIFNVEFNQIYLFIQQQIEKKLDHTHTQSQKEKNWSIIKINFRATTIHNIRTFKKKRKSYPAYISELAMRYNDDDDDDHLQ